MTPTVTLPPELLEKLQQLAQAEQLSVDQLSEYVLAQYVTEQLSEAENAEQLDKAELADLMYAIAVSEEEEARGFSNPHEEVMQRMEKKLANYRNHHKEPSA